MSKEEERMSKKEMNKNVDENKKEKASRKENSPAKKKMILNTILQGLIAGSGGSPYNGKHF